MSTNANNGHGSPASKILVIDDDEGLRANICAALKKSGHEVITARSGEEGIKAAGETPPDLVVCDVFMEGMDGYGVLEGLRANAVTASVPVILMTGDTEVAGVRRSMEAGADDYLPKPFGMRDLVVAVETQLQKRTALRERQREIEERLLAIIEVTTDFVGIVDFKTRRVIHLNQAGRHCTGMLAEEDACNLTISDFHPRTAAEQLEREILPIVLRDGSWQGEMVFRRRDGIEWIASQVILAHRNTSGDVDCLSTIARDITQQKQAERERNLLEVQHRHTQKLESIGQLAAGIAHEINTPTQYIGDNLRFLRDSFSDLAKLQAGYRQLLAAALESRITPELIREVQALESSAGSEYLLPELPKAAAQALEGATRVSDIVRALKEFSHPGSREKTPMDLNRAIESTLTVSRNEWKYCADLVTEFDATLPLVPCLGNEFNQVMLNLIVNAAHAMADVPSVKAGKKGTLRVSTRAAGDWAEVLVQDTGTGIPEQIRNRIFDPFFTTKPLGRGTGQGLAISRSVIVDKHGGTIHFETESGRGTTFIVRLPLRLPAGNGSPKRNHENASPLC